MIPALPPAFVTRPLAHRAYHDRAAGRPENSPEAIEAAINAGYGIEIDLQLSKDNQAMVFHDYELDRLTAKTGLIRDHSAAELGEIHLTGGGSTIPTLAQVLAQIAGRTPLLIEIKDQDHNMGPNIGPLEQATATALTGYKGPVALMSFNPHTVARMAELCPDLPRGLTTGSYDYAEYAPLTADICDALRDIPDYTRCEASFISHECQDLDRPRIRALKSQGATILCWTVKSPADEDFARRFADNITFEQYPAPIPT